MIIPKTRERHIFPSLNHRTYHYLHIGSLDLSRGIYHQGTQKAPAKRVQRQLSNPAIAGFLFFQTISCKNVVVVVVVLMLQILRFQPKMSLFSKYERQKDRRTLTERRLIFEDFEAAKSAVRWRDWWNDWVID